MAVILKRLYTCNLIFDDLFEKFVLLVRSMILLTYLSHVGTIKDT